MDEGWENEPITCTLCSQEDYPLTQRLYSVGYDEQENRVRVELWLCPKCQKQSQEEPYRFHQEITAIVQQNPE